MINGKSVLAIIPARVGSKGLPGKNLKELCGKPLIAWSIDVGLRSKYIDLLIVSTDGLEIAKIAEKYGASVPFIRPPELATDQATSIEVIKHALNYCEGAGLNFDYTILLEPTSPLREVDDIDRALESLVDNEQFLSIVGVAKTESQNPAFLVKLGKSNSLSGLYSSEIGKIRRQDIQDVYFLEGSIYISETRILQERETFYHQDTMGYIFPKWKSLEIDDLEDFTMVEALMSRKKFVI